jgi:hypothetical protein
VSEPASEGVEVTTETEATPVEALAAAVEAAAEGKTEAGPKHSAGGSFDVGQVVYILLREEPQVFPAIVSGQNLKRTLEGSIYSWELTVGPPGPKSKTYDSKMIPGDVYGSVDEVFAAIMRRFEMFAVGVCTEAKRIAEEFYPPQMSSPSAPLTSKQFLNDMNAVQAQIHPQYPQPQHSGPMMYPVAPPQQRFVNKYVDPELLKREQ